MNGRVDNDDGSEVATNRIRELLDQANQDGGPVHPLSVQIAGDCMLYFDGITVRDYFASQALIGILASHKGFLVDVATSNAPGWAYDFADLMIAERKRRWEATNAAD